MKGVRTQFVLSIEECQSAFTSADKEILTFKYLLIPLTCKDLYFYLKKEPATLFVLTNQHYRHKIEICLLMRPPFRLFKF